MYIHTYIYIKLSQKKEWNLAICNNIDGLGRGYVKSDKSERYKIDYRVVLYNVENIANIL